MQCADQPSAPPPSLAAFAQVQQGAQQNPRDTPGARGGALQPNDTVARHVGPIGLDRRARAAPVTACRHHVGITGRHAAAHITVHDRWRFYPEGRKAPSFLILCVDYGGQHSQAMQDTHYDKVSVPRNCLS